VRFLLKSGGGPAIKDRTLSIVLLRIVTENKDSLAAGSGNAGEGEV
jgi:hypothetical protein